jgi:hypothetical protein
MAQGSANHALNNLNASTPVLLNSVATSLHPINKTQLNSWNFMDIVVQNVDASATVYLGGSTVSSTSYGYKLAPGTSLQLQNLNSQIQLYAISSGNSALAVLQIAK